MTTAQKIFLFFSVVCYVLVLYSFFQLAPWMILLFFVLHSIFLMCFAYLCYVSAQMPMPQDESEELAELTKQHEILMLENARLSEKLARANEALSAAQSAQQPDEPESERNAAYEALLPPVEGNPDFKEFIDIIQVAKDTIQEFLPFSQKAGIQIHTSSASEALPVKAHTQRIRTLFRNIIDNSIKYMNRSGNLIITMSAVGDDIFIVLKDNGCGLPEAETPHVFEMNYQGSNRISGNGLGLTQAKAIVDSYGGTIYAKSTVGKGMGIYIQIPIN